jgi:hypothetical protein
MANEEQQPRREDTIDYYELISNWKHETPFDVVYARSKDYKKKYDIAKHVIDDPRVRNKLQFIRDFIPSSELQTK